MKKALLGIMFLTACQITFADQGSFESVLGGSAINLYSIDIENGKATAGQLTGTTTITQSSGELFIIGEHSTFDCALLLQNTTSLTNLIGYCTMADIATGDQLFMNNNRSVGDTDAGSGGTGVSEIVGGTGKYTGVKGSCTYTVTYLPGSRVAAINKCKWSK